MRGLFVALTLLAVACEAEPGATMAEPEQPMPGEPEWSCADARTAITEECEAEYWAYVYSDPIADPEATDEWEECAGAFDGFTVFTSDEELSAAQVAELCDFQESPDCVDAAPLCD